MRLSLHAPPISLFILSLEMYLVNTSREAPRYNIFSSPLSTCSSQQEKVFSLTLFPAPVSFVNHYAMNMYGGVEAQVHQLILGVTWKRVISFTLRQLYPQGNDLHYPLCGRICGLQNSCERCVNWPFPF